MKKSMLVAAVAIGSLLFCATMASAQDTTKKSERRAMSQQQLDRMNEELKLTDDQKPKVKAAFEEQSKKMQEIRSDSNLSQEQRREKFTAAREEMNKKMKEILKPEQFEKWQKMREEMRQKGGGKKGEGKGEKKGEGKKTA